MPNPQARRRVEDYTNASLVLAFVNLIWILSVIWAAFGFAWVLFSGLVLNHLVTWIAHRIALREAALAWPKPKQTD